VTRVTRPEAASWARPKDKELRLDERKEKSRAEEAGNRGILVARGAVCLLQMLPFDVAKPLPDLHGIDESSDVVFGGQSSFTSIP
jgi:hypothetical protein